MLYGAELIKSQVLFRTAHKGQTSITINTDHVLIKLQLVFPGVARWFNVDYIYLFTSSSELPSFWFAVTLRFNRKGRKYFSWFSCWRSTVRPAIKIVVFWLNCLSPTIDLTWHTSWLSLCVWPAHTHTLQRVWAWPVASRCLPSPRLPSAPKPLWPETFLHPLLLFRFHQSVSAFFFIVHKQSVRDSQFTSFLYFS